MISGAAANTFQNELTIVKISNVEFYNVGQLFTLGGYAIYFNMLGDSPSSYISECSIHQSFNRAVDVQGTNYITIEKTVIYDILGGALFLEDGVEIGNTFQYNLAVYVMESTSLLNEDSTPGKINLIFFFSLLYLSFFLLFKLPFGLQIQTTQYSIMQSQVEVITVNCLGTLNRPEITLFFCKGYWYRLLNLASTATFGTFYNNTVHSVGSYGLWIFPTYTPSVSHATFEKFVSYLNDKGAEWVSSNKVQFKNFIVYDHATSGIETKLIPGNSGSGYYGFFYDETNGPTIVNSTIIGNSDSSANSSITPIGLVVARDRGQLIKNINFFNFPDVNSYAIRVAKVDGTCR